MAQYESGYAVHDREHPPFLTPHVLAFLIRTPLEAEARRSQGVDVCLHQIDVPVGPPLHGNRMHRRARLPQNLRYSVRRDAEGEDRQGQRDDHRSEMPALESAVVAEPVSAVLALEPPGRILAPARADTVFVVRLRRALRAGRLCRLYYELLFQGYGLGLPHQGGLYCSHVLTAAPASLFMVLALAVKPVLCENHLVPLPGDGL